VHIDKLWIDGLRGLKDAEIRFHPGLNVLVGENNAGKTTILMALRLVLSASDEVDRPFLCVDDLHMGEDGPVDAIQIECTLGGLSPADQGRMLEALIATTAPPTAKVAVTVVKTESGKLKVRHWCGTSKDNALPSALLDWMGLAFLPPLRDPTRGLLPGRRSQFASLLSELTTKEEVAELEKAVKAANDDLSLEAAVVRTREAVNSALVAVTGPELAQNATLGFTASDFEQLLHTLSARVDGLSVSQNGLGYNNLLYTATVLAALRKDSDLSFRLFLVEEPEAHLHPHLQALLYRYLAETAEDAPKTQLFVSTHSTHIASAVDPRKCVVLNASGGFKAMRLSDIELKPRSWNKLGRYLDATRSSLLFARRVILVEGISEAILISAIARACGYDLRDYSVSVVSTEGLNFSEFMSLLGAKGLGRRCAVVTDADGVLFGKRYYPGARGPRAFSPAAASIIRQASGTVEVFVARSTLEYDVVLYGSANQDIALKAIEELHPRLVGVLRAEMEQHSSIEQRAAVFHEFLFESRSTNKVEFAEAMAEHLKGSTDFVVPHHILGAILHVTAAE